VMPEVVRCARTSVAAKSDRWRITRSRLTDAIEPAFDGVPLESHEESSVGGHALSFARLCTIVVH